MSGPKSSRYTLTAEQRRILAAQREVKRRRSVAQKAIQRDRIKLLQMNGMYDAEKQISMALSNRTGSDNDYRQQYLQLQDVIRSSDAYFAQANSEDVEALEKSASAINRLALQADQISRDMTKIAATNERLLHAKLTAEIDKGFDTSFADLTARDEQTIQAMQESTIQQLMQIQQNTFLPPEYKKEIEITVNTAKAIQDQSFMKNYVSVKVLPLLKKYNQYLLEYEQCHDTFDRLYIEYLALCELYHCVAQKYPCCEHSIGTIRKEMCRINETVAKDDEQSYINNCVDEAMTEMGYSVLGSREVTKKSGKHFRNELYTYAEGAAVNITYSSDGKIAMELGGLDDTDRTPSELETDVLCYAMEDFCEDFKEIEKKLIARGVILADRISLLPPSADYAQIINTSDYQMQKEASLLNVKKRNRPVQQKQPLRRE